jgi:hypothetical protein
MKIFFNLLFYENLFEENEIPNDLTVITVHRVTWYNEYMYK